MNITGDALALIKTRIRGEEREIMSTTEENKTAVQTYKEDTKKMAKNKRKSLGKEKKPLIRTGKVELKEKKMTKRIRRKKRRKRKRVKRP